MELSKLQLAQVLEAQIRQALDAFKKDYNKANVVNGNYIDYRLVVVDKLLKKSLELSIVKNGNSAIAYRKSYGFEHPVQIANEGEWTLTLWQDLFNTLVTGGAMYSLVLQDARKEANTQP